MTPLLHDGPRHRTQVDLVTWDVGTRPGVTGSRPVKGSIHLRDVLLSGKESKWVGGGGSRVESRPVCPPVTVSLGVDRGHQECPGPESIGSGGVDS